MREAAWCRMFSEPERLIPVNRELFTTLKFTQDMPTVLENKYLRNQQY